MQKSIYLSKMGMAQNTLLVIQQLTATVSKFCNFYFGGVQNGKCETAH